MADLFYTVNVNMLAFCSEPDVIREVGIPESQWPYPDMGDSDLTPGVRETLLDLVFHYGQNIHQNKPFSSVSSGDVIDLEQPDGKVHHYLVLGIGFTELTEREFQMYKLLPRASRIEVYFGTGGE